MGTHDELMMCISGGLYALERYHAGQLDRNGNEIGEVFVKNSVFNAYQLDDFVLILYSNGSVCVYYQNENVFSLK